MDKMDKDEQIATGPAWSDEFAAMLDAYQQAGGNPEVLKSRQVARLVVSANQVLAAHGVPGIHLEAEERPNGVKARIVVEPDTRSLGPIHLCFGMLPAEGVQEIDAEYEIGPRAHIEVIAHCTFPNAQRLKHAMNAIIHVGAGAAFAYSEAHFHGPYGGIEVLPKATVTVSDDARFATAFSLTDGRVGKLAFDYDVNVGIGGVAELTTKVYGQANDDIRVNEVIRLNGNGARGLTKTRVAVRDEATSEVLTTAEGNAPFTRGHMDCTEIVRDRAVARNMPLVIVRDDRARVTHEAAIGSVSRRELETLMARGLDESTAVDVIIRGLLR
jgi:Fe-S cluster assembly scaffold protein SufB